VTKSRWLILFALFLARSSMGFQFQTVASTAPFLARAFGVGYTEIGMLIGLYMLPGIVIALPGGMLGKRFGDKRICAAGLLLMIVGGIVFASSASFAAAFTGRLVSGVGAVLFNLVLTKMVTDWFAGREIVTAMGAVLASWPFGIGVALVVQAPLAASAYGWLAVMDAAAGLCALALLLVGAVYRPPDAVRAVAAQARAQAQAQAPRPGALIPLREALPSATAGVIWGVFNVGLIVFFSFVPGLLAEQGMALAEAGVLTSLGLWTSMASTALGGFLAERSGHPHAAIVVFSALSGLVMVLLPFLPLAATLCALLGIVIGPAAGAIMALPAKVLRPENRAFGLGIFYTVYYVIMAGGPAIAGYCRDIAGTATASVLLGAALFWIVPPLLLLFTALAARAPRDF